jgi:hypothetical protein
MYLATGQRRPDQRHEVLDRRFVERGRPLGGRHPQDPAVGRDLDPDALLRRHVGLLTVTREALRRDRHE